MKKFKISYTCSVNYMFESLEAAKEYAATMFSSEATVEEITEYLFPGDMIVNRNGERYALIKM